MEPTEEQLERGFCVHGCAPWEFCPYCDEDEDEEPGIIPLTYLNEAEE